MAVEALEPLLSDAGWAYASLPPQEPGDPGRFHALFGRDSLITALQVLPEAPEVAVATLRALAALQGRADDPATDEEPGKILHEFRPVAEPRFAAAGWPVRDGELRYYGSADSTSWFLVVLAALQDDGLAAELADARRRAGEWLARALDAGGGLVRYGPRRAPGGLAHQGWRDATAPVSEHSEGSGIVRPDGSDPEPPLADADCQAAAHAALRALARLDPDGDWDARATALRARVGEAFAPGADVGAGDRGRRHGGPGRRLAARLAPLGRRARAGPRRRRGAAARRARRPHGVRAAHARRRPSRVPARQLPPRRDLAVRLVARLGRAAGPGAGRRGGAGPDRRARRARPARPGAGAVRGLGGGRARGDPGRQPGPGLDGRRALGARARLGRARMTNSHGRDSVLG